MGKNSLKWILIAVILLLFAGCSGVEHQLITKDSVTSRDNTLVVVGIKWVEVYNDAKAEAKEKDTIIKTQRSYQLLDDNALVLRNLVKKNDPELHHPLYYLHHFKFIFNDEQGEEHTFIRFGKDLRQYEPYAIYELPPGTYRLNQIDWRENRFQAGQGGNYPVLDQLFFEGRSEQFGQWTLPAGKIVYLGEITIRFHTKRIIFGIITPVEAEKEIDLLQIDIEDKFEQTIADLKKQKPWFPATEMVNLSSPGKWVYSQLPEELLKRKGNEEGGSEESPVQKEKDKNAFF